VVSSPLIAQAQELVLDQVVLLVQVVPGEAAVGVAVTLVAGLRNTLVLFNSFF